MPAIPTTAKSPPTLLATRHGGEGRALTGYQATLFTDNGAVSQVTVSNVKSAGKNNILILPPCSESNFTIIKDNNVEREAAYLRVLETVGCDSASDSRKNC